MPKTRQRPRSLKQQERSEKEEIMSMCVLTHYFNLWMFFCFLCTGEFTVCVIISKGKQENPANLTGLDIHPGLLALCQKLSIFNILFIASFLKTSENEFLAIFTFLWTYLPSLTILLKLDIPFLFILFLCAGSWPEILKVKFHRRSRWHKDLRRKIL